MGQIESGEAYVTEEQYPAIMAEFNSRTLKAGNDTGTLVIDLPSLISLDAASFYDGMHFNEAGNRLVAEFLKGEIVQKMKAVR